MDLDEGLIKYIVGISLHLLDQLPGLWSAQRGWQELEVGSGG
jgi:hypothetical protein